ncbi:MULTISPECIES: helix-turn-helix domain-containing protein [Niastella]|uniref:Helix-turn-helix transcriptional regulator n=1 Tax=Niastella soli TaxID=2821487 RepID=A0ABS3YQV0_9BACT|nr:helix-turn-helix transcriptional regulator [Niastella soli]MBO9200173.1 helix-turn-helix transcriptional regulator [Niastella soli]
MKTFGANLRQLRNEKGLSQRDLYALCNIDNAEISRMENGEVNVTLNTLAQLAEALDIPAYLLLRQ